MLSAVSLGVLCLKKSSYYYGSKQRYTSVPFVDLTAPSHPSIPYHHRHARSSAAAPPSPLIAAAMILPVSARPTWNSWRTAGPDGASKQAPHLRPSHGADELGDDGFPCCCCPSSAPPSPDVSTVGITKMIRFPGPIHPPLRTNALQSSNPSLPPSFPPLPSQTETIKRSRPSTRSPGTPLAWPARALHHEVSTMFS